MTKAQKWLEGNYPRDQRGREVNNEQKEKIKGSLDFEGFTNLVRINIENNLEKSTWKNLGKGDKITSLKLESVTNLEELNCKNNAITVLSLKGNTKLKNLNCSFNKIEILDVRGLAELTELRCYCNKLITLEIDGCSSLWKLSCTDNKLESIDFLKKLPSKQKQTLTFLDISDNNFSKQSLEFLEGFTFLKSLYVENWKKTKSEKEGNKFSGTLTHLKTLTKLENLSVSNTDICGDEKDKESLKSLPDVLKRINYGGCEIIASVLGNHTGASVRDYKGSPSINNHEQNSNNQIVSYVRRLLSDNDEMRPNSSFLPDNWKERLVRKSELDSMFDFLERFAERYATKEDLEKELSEEPELKAYIQKNIK